MEVVAWCGNNCLLCRQRRLLWLWPTVTTTVVLENAASNGDVRRHNPLLDLIREVKQQCSNYKKRVKDGCKEDVGTGCAQDKRRCSSWDVLEIYMVDGVMTMSDDDGEAWTAWMEDGNWKPWRRGELRPRQYGNNYTTRCLRVTMTKTCVVLP